MICAPLREALVSCTVTPLSSRRGGRHRSTGPVIGGGPTRVACVFHGRIRLYPRCARRRAAVFHQHEKDIDPLS